ncbi:thymidine kinase [Subtercola frigoramans]|uniref:Thymidine kinase n=1 Tax=Subtercola frigoramans TaxID=120298 RepID=A0ABS2L8H3_9MICO|nr:thymidine kinase [Subtercola frigoramans]MBM7473377.1 thymidine kinase [Subtercola frigoramans]
MAKLYFRYGAMNSGKSTALLQAAFNYEERGHRVLIAKPATDTKGDRQVVSRLGVTRDVDFLVAPDDSLFEAFQLHRDERRVERGEERGAKGTSGIISDEPAAVRSDVSCLLIDEAQFLTRDQVDDALRIALIESVPVLAYGIRTDFLTSAFPGSARLLEVAHSLEELKTICRCGRKAIFNPRLVNGRFVFDGDQVAIDGDSVTYESLCGVCYLEESNGLLGAAHRD